MKRLALLALLLPTAINAQTGVVIPDEATKRCALLKAYHMNGDSMVRYGAIDLSDEPCAKPVMTVPVPVTPPDTSKEGNDETNRQPDKTATRNPAQDRHRPRKRD